MIKQDNLVIRGVEPEDLDLLYRIGSDPEVKGVYLPGKILNKQQYLNEYKENGFSRETSERLVLEMDGRVVGMLWHFLSVPYFDAREIGYLLFEKGLRGKGITPKAVTMLVNYLFLTHPLNRVEIRMDSSNTASERVAEKCGFTYEGIARKAYFLHGKHRDVKLYSLLREEWEQGRTF